MKKVSCIDNDAAKAAAKTGDEKNVVTTVTVNKV